MLNWLLIFVPVAIKPAAGRTDVTLQTFGAFFLKYKVTACELKGNFIYAVAPGTAGGGSGGGTPGPVVFTLRLVK